MEIPELLTSLKLRILGGIDTVVDLLSSGGQSQLALLIAVGALVLFLVLVRIAGRSNSRHDGFDRTSAVLGRLEKLELNLNEFKTNSMRAIEQFKGDVGYLRIELEEIKRLVGGQSGTGGSEPGFGTGGESSGGSSEDPSASSAAPVTQALPPLAQPSPVCEVSPPEEVAPPSLSSRLTKTRQGFLGRLKRLFQLKPIVDEKLFEELEAVLVEADIGIATTTKLIASLRGEIERGVNVDEDALRSLLKTKILERIAADGGPAPFVPERQSGGPLVVMVVGVNGVGKTTTVAKLAQRWKDDGLKVLVVAADTFRAAAVDQLSEWGSRVGVPVVSGAQDAKPSTVVFDGMARAVRENFDAVIIDTAGRLHTKTNLMAELEGIRNVIERHQAGAPHETFLVLDGATGQNALSQAREFNDAVKLTGLIVTKLDGTPRGGIVVAIHDELKIPVRFVGVGESPHDLRVFEPRSFVEALFDTSGVTALEEPSAHAAVRRRRRDGEGLACV